MEIPPPYPFPEQWDELFSKHDQNAWLSPCNNILHLDPIENYEKEWAVESISILQNEEMNSQDSQMIHQRPPQRIYTDCSDANTPEELKDNELGMDSGYQVSEEWQELIVRGYKKLQSRMKRKK